MKNTVFKRQNPVYAIKMATEIELKAHIEDKEAVKRLLFDKAVFLWAFEKEDTYWFQEPPSCPGFPRSGIRLRREKCTLPDGSEKISCLATYKNKEKRDGIEINDEKEFEIVSKPDQNGPEFEEFLLCLGLKPGISKKKRGWAFSREGINNPAVEQQGIKPSPRITAELCEVEGLGWFVELEILTDNADNGKDAYAESRKRLLDFLYSLGIKKEAIESRFYTELLKGSKPLSI